MAARARLKKPSGSARHTCNESGHPAVRSAGDGDRKRCGNFCDIAKMTNTPQRRAPAADVGVNPTTTDPGL
jgi:hypothetical protein